MTALCGLRVTVETYVALKGPMQCHRFGHTQRNCGYAPRCVACGGAHQSGGCSNSRLQLKCCSCGVNHTANYRGCSKWKKAKAALARQARTPRGSSGETSRPAVKKVARAAPSAEQLSLGDGWNHVVRFEALENLNDSEDIKRAWKNIKENIKITAKEKLNL